MGRAYVGFARTHPALFLLMFRSDRLDVEHPALRDAAAETAARSASSLLLGSPKTGAVKGGARAAALWSLVHGFALLLIDHQLDGMIAAQPPGSGVDGLLDAVSSVTRLSEA
jgi:hypothetical protein